MLRRNWPGNSRLLYPLLLLLLGGLLGAGMTLAQPVRACQFLSNSLHQEEASQQEPSFSSLARLLETGEDVLKIRVVVHVVYSEPAQNISDAQIYSQLEVLNRDYRRKNADTAQTLTVFKAFAADARIEFYLAKEDEQGKATNGITRTATTHGPFGNADIHETAKGGKNPWNPEKFLNIWVCNLAPGALGYGTSPGTPPDRDGVVVHYQQVGTLGTVVEPYTKGRTMTHEVGHWLGLKHLWGLVGGCQDDDGIADTPPQESASTGCQLERVSCGGRNMVQNYMDYSDDACMNLFTEGQKAVMRQTLRQARPNVLDPNAGPIVLGEEQPENKRLRGIFPNPSPDGRFYSRQPSGMPAHWWLWDAIGRVIAEGTFPAGATEQMLALDALPKGCYVFVLRVGNQVMHQRVLSLKEAH